MGSMIPPVRRAQQEMSIFVEVGWDDDEERPGRPGHLRLRLRRLRQLRRRGRRLRADGQDLPQPPPRRPHERPDPHLLLRAVGRPQVAPLRLGARAPPASGTRTGRTTTTTTAPRPSARPSATPAGGTRRASASRGRATRTTSAPPGRAGGSPYEPVPVGDDDPSDGYALVPIELDWTRYGQKPGDNVAYWNRETGVKITHFPVIHCRQGSIGYKLEWNGLSMIYTSDTRPETHCIKQAINGGKGVDVFIHEMVVPPEVWAMKNMGLTAARPAATPGTRSVDGHDEGPGQLPHPAGGLRLPPEPDRPQAAAHGRHPLPGGRRHRRVRPEERAEARPDHGAGHRKTGT